MILFKKILQSIKIYDIIFVAKSRVCNIFIVLICLQEIKKYLREKYMNLKSQLKKMFSGILSFTVFSTLLQFASKSIRY